MEYDDDLAEVRAQADRIEDAYETIERAVVTLSDPEEWRIALGLIEGTNRRGYDVKKRMLSHAHKLSQT
jgi:hypothetical protein